MYKNKEMYKNKDMKSIELAGEKRMQKFSVLHGFIASERGATAIEYALIAGGISVVIVGTVIAIGVDVTGLFTTVQSAFN